MNGRWRKEKTTYIHAYIRLNARENIERFSASHTLSIQLFLLRSGVHLFWGFVVNASPWQVCGRSGPSHRSPLYLPRACRWWYAAAPSDFSRAPAWWAWAGGRGGCTPFPRPHLTPEAPQPAEVLKRHERIYVRCTCAHMASLQSSWLETNKLHQRTPQTVQANSKWTLIWWHYMPISVCCHPIDAAAFAFSRFPPSNLHWWLLYRTPASSFNK